jgi:aldose 1-epimerase
LVPTGKITAVDNSVYDLRNPTLLGPAMAANAGVFDINYVLNGTPGEVRPCARLRHRLSGRTLTLSTNMPGLQFYNGHKIYDQDMTGKGGYRYPAWAGLCLETQAFPNAVNHPNFPSMVLRPGERYHHHTTYDFTIA